MPIKKVRMTLTLNPRVWILAERLFIHSYGHEAFLTLLHQHDIDFDGENYDGFPTTKPLYTFMSEENFAFPSFMELVPAYKYLPLLEKIVFDAKVVATQYDHWNYYGEFIRHWYPDLMSLLNLAEVSVDIEHKKLEYPDIEQPPIEADFLPESFGDVFLDYIRKEINESQKAGLYLSTMFLARKMFETIIVRLFEVVFPKLVNKQYKKENHELWYDLEKGKTHNFERLLENLKSQAAAFHEDKDLVLEVASLIKPFKDETNKYVHFDYKIPDIAYVNQWRIPKLAALARKMFRKYCNP